MSNSNRKTYIDRDDNAFNKYLSFRIANEIYGIDILRVQEIIGIMEITSIPNLPEFVRGIINLRDQVIPVLDLRVKFGVPNQDNERNCIIIIQVKHDNKSFTIGIYVDEVADVIRLDKANIEPSPKFGKDVNTNYIGGIGKMEKVTILLLNIDILFENRELNAKKTLTKSEAEEETRFAA